MGKIVTVFTEEAPKPLGHYSQAVRGGGLIHISGQLPIARSGVPDNQSASFNAQAKLVLAELSGDTRRRRGRKGRMC